MTSGLSVRVLIKIEERRAKGEQKEREVWERSGRRSQMKGERGKGEKGESTSLEASRFIFQRSADNGFCFWINFSFVVFQVFNLTIHS
jgi:hypothetical protein